jgi:hypothetical protein
MSGALLQLVAIGAQDALLIGDPEITFFQLVTRSHTNFAVESIDQTVNGTPGFGRTISCTVSRNGDLVSRVYVEATLPKLVANSSSSDSGAAASPLDNGFSWIHNVGNFLIQEADVEIGGQRIDRHYGEWLHIWNELSGSHSHQAGYNRMIGNVPELQSAYEFKNEVYQLRTQLPSKKLLVPLQFWFCRSPGLALPLIALQYHEVKINITFESLDKLIRVKQLADDSEASITEVIADSDNDDSLGTDAGWAYNSGISKSNFNNSGDLEVKLWVDYVYLDNEERRRFATTAHNYLIDQLQTTGCESIRGAHDRFRLNFNHPIKELVWVVQSHTNPMGVYSFPGMAKVQQKSKTYASERMNLATQSNLDEVRYTGENPVATSKLILNGHDRFKERDSMYFDSVQTYQHHTNTPERPGINVFSFGLKPEEHQPSGTCNFSRIDNATLELYFRDFSNSSSTKYYQNSNLAVYAVNYNQLRIISGMGGLTYSN